MFSFDVGLLCSVFMCAPVDTAACRRFEAFRQHVALEFDAQV